MQHSESFQRLEIHSESQESKLDMVNSTLPTVADAFSHIQEFINFMHASRQTSQQASQNINSNLDDLNGKMNNLSEKSQEQFDMMKSMFKGMRIRFETQLPSQPTEAAVRLEDIDMDEAESQTSGDDTNFQAAITRLYALAQEKGKTFYSDEVQSIIEDVEQILDHANNFKTQQPLHHDWKGKKRARDEDEDDVEEIKRQHIGIRKMKGLLTASHHLAINGKGMFYAF